MTYQAIELQARRMARHPSRAGAAGRYRDPKIAVRQRPVPTLSAGQVLLEVCSVSICGSDVHALETDAEGYSCTSVPAANWETGIQFGHEVAARVAAVGPSVNGLEVGDYVAADSLVPCRSPHCRTCRAGNWNACPRAYLLGMQVDGVFGELAVAPAVSLHSIAGLMRRYGRKQGVRVGSLAEPLGVALQAWSQATRWLCQSRPRVLVLGAGPIGLFFAWKARLAGAERIVVVEPNPLRAEFAGQFADLVVPPGENNDQFHSETFDSGPDIVLDACGQADLKAILDGLASGGVLVNAARSAQQVCFECDSMITQGHAIVGTRGHVGHVPAAIDMLTHCDFDPTMFLTRSLDSLSQLAAILRDSQQLAGELKVSCQIAIPSRLLCTC